MKKLFLLLLCITFLFACKEKTTDLEDTQSSQVIDFDEILDNSDLYVNDLIDSIRIIKLQTTEESVLSSFYQCLITQKYIYILDEYKGGSVVIFDVNGSFVKRLPYGNGPGELLRPSSISFNEEKDELVVYQSKLVNIFTPDGVFKTAYRLPFYLSQLVPYKDGYIAVQYETNNLEKKFAFIVLDSEFRDVNTFYFEERRCDILSEFVLKTHKNDIIINRPLWDVIYKYSDGIVSEDRRLEYPQNKMDFSLIDWQNVDSYVDMLELSPDKFAFISYNETNNYEYYRFNRGFFNAYVFICKKNKKYRSGYAIIDPNSIYHVGDYVGTYNIYLLMSIIQAFIIMT
ncbi:MAG: 6-bladed beta-propeller [Bacteroidales bacterium]|nr:6-bladed beta-propeller [Bacteroidales bacterium]